MFNEDEQLNFKIIILGNQNVGKTTFCNQIIHGESAPVTSTTIGVQFRSKIIKVSENVQVKATIWDTAGQQQFESLNKLYYKGACAIIFFYDITNAKSYIDIQEWMKKANQHIELLEISLIIVGNKLDLSSDRVVEKKRAVQQYEEKLGIDCCQISALTGQKVDQMFQFFVKKIFRSLQSMSGQYCSDILQEIKDSEYTNDVLQSCYSNRLSKLPNNMRPLSHRTINLTKKAMNTNTLDAIQQANEKSEKSNSFVQKKKNVAEHFDKEYHVILFE